MTSKKKIQKKQNGWNLKKQQIIKERKNKCVHCDQKISSKIERLREHLKRCTVYAKNVPSKEEELDPDDLPTEIINLEKTSTFDPRLNFKYLMCLV